MSRATSQPAEGISSHTCATAHPARPGPHRYYQCLPGNASSPGGGNLNYGGTPGVIAGTLGLWAQCGGKGGNCASFECADAIYPNQTCAAGTSCQRMDEWYSQCRPAGTMWGTCTQVRGGGGRVAFCGLCL
jgi:hypothetical protein